MTVRKRKQLDTIAITLQAIAAALIAAGLFLIISNWATVTALVGYSIDPPENPKVIIITPPPVTKTTTPKPTPAVNEPAHIVIPKIGVDAPINWNVPIDKVVDTLSHGIVHIQGTAHLDGGGNTVLIGHSSDYIWKHDPYAAVFALLPNLKPNDNILIRQNGQVYAYKVTDTEIVRPTDVQVTAATQSPVLTLVTCYPVGTATNRFIVRAVLISGPHGVPKATDTASKTLPVINFR